MMSEINVKIGKLFRNGTFLANKKMRFLLICCNLAFINKEKENGIM